MKYLRLIFACMLSLPQLLSAQVPVIQSVTAMSAVVEQHGKFEAQLALTAGYTNPYDYDNIRVEAVFTAPDGSQTRVEGFYMEGFQIASEATGALSATGSNGFRLRFSPRQTGTWSYTVSCTNTQGTGTFPAQTFTCTAPATAENKGFVRSGSSNYLFFDNGEQYIPIGENIAWQNGNPYLDYKKWVGKMADNQGNFLRLWLCHWGLGVEWKNNSNGFSGLRRYKQSNAYYLDWLFDFCAEKGVYVMFCLNHHGQVSSQVNPNWSESPYNAANGGPCQNTWDFFSNAQAKAAHKNRLRYTLARWGYQRSIMTWELFNEVNWTDNYDQHKPAIADWHAEMAAFLKQNDYANRPVSTSYGSPQSEDPALWNNPDMEYSQRHYYIDSPNLEAILASGARENLSLYDKPAHIGEFGLSAGGGDLGNLDPNGIHIHNNLWGPVFGGGLGTGMTWWWDSYIDPKNLYYHFIGLGVLLPSIPLHAGDFRPAAAVVEGAPGDLSLQAGLGWGELGDELLQISGSGAITPANYKLSQFLYGAVWNTQFRSPPSFEVTMPQSGEFKVQVGAQFGQSPKLEIRVDGAVALSVTPAANQTYTVLVPAGQHTIKVDNTGTDWMTIAGYTIEGLGSSVDAYVLKAADHKSMAAWVLNRAYNHVNVKANGAPNSIAGASLRVPNMADGDYAARWYNCLTGNLELEETVTAVSGVLQLAVPELLWDVLVVVDGNVVGTHENTLAAPLPMQVFPNPAGETPVYVQFTIEQTAPVWIQLLDAAGQPVQTLYKGVMNAGKQQVEAQIDRDLPAGMYWVQLIAGEKSNVKAIGVMRF
jgi:hypothetical protein